MEKQAALTLEAAESKKKVLAQYMIRETDQGTRVRGQEGPFRRAGQAGEWELARARRRTARKESKRTESARGPERILALLDQAIPLEEKIRARLAEASKTEQLPESKTDEIVQLIHDLAALVDRAESLRDIGDFARLKPQIQQAARRYKVSAAK